MSVHAYGINVLSLFSGIGGIELGLERAGMTTVGQVEVNEYCRRVLEQHWPGIPRHDDMRSTVEWWESESRPPVDVVAGGVPCQPFSYLGRQKGVTDERWGWPWMANVVRVLRPRYVLMETVSPLVRDNVAFGEILTDLHLFGFNAEWATVRAADFGAPHSRERVYILAYANSIEARSELAAGGIGRGQGSPFPVAGLFGLPVAERRQRAHAWLESEPLVDRMVNGVPDQLDRLRVLGNAVVPQIAEHIGKHIVSVELENI